MKVYKVVYNDNFKFSVDTYDFWSYVFSKKKKKGWLFFNEQKALDWMNGFNQLALEVVDEVSKYYDEFREQYFADPICDVTEEHNHLEKDDYLEVVEKIECGV